jgi:hypothetical protein
MRGMKAHMSTHNKGLGELLDEKVATETAARQMLEVAEAERRRKEQEANDLLRKRRDELQVALDRKVEETRGQVTYQLGENGFIIHFREQRLEVSLHYVGDGEVDVHGHGRVQQAEWDFHLTPTGAFCHVRFRGNPMVSRDASERQPRSTAEYAKWVNTFSRGMGEIVIERMALRAEALFHEMMAKMIELG